MNYLECIELLICENCGNNIFDSETYYFNMDC
jgi:hypothetical protein